MHGPEIREAILERLSQGESLRAICRDEEMPGTTSVKRWLLEDAEFRSRYAQAREEGADVEFDELADLQAELPERTQTGSVDTGWVAWKRLQIDTKKWALSKKVPKKYGEKQETTLELGDTVSKVIREIVRAG